MYKELTNEDLVVKYQNGEKNGLEQNEILGILLKRMEGIMVQYNNSYSNIPHTDFEHRSSIILEQFLVALNEFDMSMGNKLTTVCKKYFSQGLNRLYRDMTREKRYDPNIVHNSYELMQEIKKDKEDKDSELNKGVELSEFSNFEILDLLNTAGLNEKQFSMCVGFIEGKNANEIADELGVTPQAVSWYKREAKKKLQIALNF